MPPGSESLPVMQIAVILILPPKQKNDLFQIYSKKHVYMIIASISN